MGFSFGDFLEEAEEVDVCEEEARGIVREGCLWEGATGGKAELVDFRSCGWW